MDMLLCGSGPGDNTVYVACKEVYGVQAVHGSWDGEGKGSGTGVLEKDVAYAGLVLCILHSGTGGNIPGIIYTLPGMREPVYGARRKAQRMVPAGVHV